MKNSIFYIGILLLLISCDNTQETDKLNQLVEYEDISSAKPVSEVRMMIKEEINNDEKIELDRKLIKTGSIAFETRELEVTRKTIIDLVNAYNGYVANDDQYKSEDRISATISVRVPAKNFDVILEGIAKGVEKFDAKNINVSDVTEQFLDTEARLKTKKTLEVKYLEVLKIAKTVRDILDVERELGKLRGDIEATEGRLKYLQNQVSFSTLNITFYKKIVDNEASFGVKISTAFKQGFQNVKIFLISLINIWPFMITLFILIFYFRKRIFRAKS